MDSTIKQNRATRAGVIDFRDSQLRENSLEVFVGLQEADKICRLRGLKSYLATSYADCDFILSSPDFGFEEVVPNLDQAKPNLAGYYAMRRGLMLFQNQPLHKESRDQAKQLLASWSAPEIRKMVREELRICLTELKAKSLQEWDFVELLAKPFVARVAGRLLKLPLDIVNEVAAMTHEIADTLDPLSEGNSLEQTGEQYRRIEKKVEECLENISEPTACPFHRDTSSPVAAMLISASVYTTTHLLGLTVHDLLSHAKHRAMFEGEREVQATAVEELLRYHSPARMTRRVALRRIQMREQVFEKGTVIWLALGAANYDPLHFGEPNVLNLNRTPNRHLAFGKGAHKCLGAQLARIQLQVFLEEFADAFPDLELSKAEESVPLRSLIFSGFRTLWVRE